MQAPHIMFLVHASGVPYPLHTRMYFADDPGITDDHLLLRISENRRHTLLARPESRGDEKVYRFDIVLRGEAEDLSLAGKEEGEDAADAPSGAGDRIPGAALATAEIVRRTLAARGWDWF